MEILFVPGTKPPVAYVTNMHAGALSAATWDPAKQDFKVELSGDNYFCRRLIKLAVHNI